MTRAKAQARFLCLFLSAVLAVALSPITADATAYAATDTTKPRLSKTNISVYKGKTYTLKLKNTKSNKKVKWLTSNKKVVSVKQSGSKAVITGVKAGKATVTAKYGNKKYKCKVTVKNKPVALSNTSVSLKKGTRYTLKLKNATASKVKWSSSNKSVATVSKNGVVAAKKAGKATITAKYGNKKYKCTIVVKDNVVYKASSSTVEVKAGEKTSIDITYTGGGTVYCKSSDTTIATCQWSGTWSGNRIKLSITGERNGEAILSLTNSENSAIVKVKVVVKPAISFKCPSQATVKTYGTGSLNPAIVEMSNIVAKGNRTSIGQDYIEVSFAAMISDFGDLSASQSCYIPYKVYDDAGVLVNSGFEFAPYNAKRYETFSKRISIYTGTTSSSYTIEFVNRYL